MSLLFVIDLVENPTVSEEKNFLVTLPRHCHLLLLFVASLFVFWSSAVR